MHNNGHYATYGLLRVPIEINNSAGNCLTDVNEVQLRRILLRERELFYSTRSLATFGFLVVEVCRKSTWHVLQVLWLTEFSQNFNQES
jgi:hypothetical protein